MHSSGIRINQMISNRDQVFHPLHVVSIIYFATPILMSQVSLLNRAPLPTITLLVVYRSMRRNAVDAVVRIEVLVQSKLEDGC